MSPIDLVKDTLPVPTESTGSGFAWTERKEGLSKADGPLVWIDCEMTGLDHLTDRIIEIAVIVTNGQLEPADGPQGGIRYAIRTEREVLDRMGEWCVTQHGTSGLTEECLNSPHSFDHVYACILEYIQRYVPEKGVGVLAGSSVHADARFLRQYMPRIIDHLHYRIVDVSTVKELSSRWYPAREVTIEAERKDRVIAHRALDDIRASIAELQRYRDDLFLTEKEYYLRARRQKTWTGSTA